MTVPLEKAPAKLVPAAAVIRVVQTLFGFTGRKGCVDGKVSQLLNFPAQPETSSRNCFTRGWKREVEFSE